MHGKSQRASQLLHRTEESEMRTPDLDITVDVYIVPRRGDDLDITVDVYIVPRTGEALNFTVCKALEIVTVINNLLFCT